MLRRCCALPAAVVLMLYIGCIHALGNDGSCNVLTMVPFTLGDRENARFQSGGTRRSNIGFSHMAATLLAIQDFNSRDPVVVPELAGDIFASGRCTAYFNETSFLLDSHGKGTEAVAEILEQLYNRNTLDALIGGYHEQTSLEMSVVANAMKIPYIANGGLNRRVTTPYFYPYNTRTSPDVEAVGKATLSFLIHLGRTDVLTVLQAESDASFQLKEVILRDGTKQGIRVERTGYLPPILSGPPEGIRRALQEAKSIGFKTIISIVEDVETEIPVIADEAEELGMNRGDFVWLFAGKMTEQWHLAASTLLESDNVRKLLGGAAVVQAVEGFMYNPSEDKFLAYWRRQNSSFVSQVNSKNPIVPGELGHFTAQSDYFRKFDPDPGAAFLYDSIVAFGLGLCDALVNGDASAMTVVSEIHSVEFNGASGIVRFGGDPAHPGSRTRDTVTFGAYNFQLETEEGLVLTDFVRNNFLTLRVVWNSITPFRFANGSVNPPPELREMPEQNYLSPNLRIFGFCMFSVAVLLVLVSVVWVFLCRQKRVVKASQPAFLYVIHAGSFLICWGIITISFDESYGTSVETLGTLCTITPWIATLGIIFIYAALFAKLWRINKILQFRRRTVTVAQVVWPMAILIVTAIALLTAWTIVEGFDWIRVEMDDMTGETIGKCAGANSIAWFTPIFLLIIIPVLMTAYMAWRTKDIHGDFSESSWIFILILVQIQVVVIAIPVLNIIELQSANSRYIGQVMLFWIFPISTISLLIGPKVYSVYYDGTENQKRGATSGGHVRVTGLGPGGSASRLANSSVGRSHLSANGPRSDQGASSRSGQDDQSVTKERSSHTFVSIVDDTDRKVARGETRTDSLETTLEADEATAGKEKGESTDKSMADNNSSMA